MTLDELKAMIEAEALRREAARDGFTLDAVKTWLGQGAAPPPGVRQVVPPPPDPLTFRYLADINGSEFVEACYATILGRHADPAGLEQFTVMLLRGEEKAYIMGRVAYSAEGRQRNTPVVGLFPRYAIAAAKKLPLLGTVVAWLFALGSIHRQQRHARAFEQSVHARLDALAGYTAQSSEQVALRIEALRSVMESRD